MEEIKQFRDKVVEIVTASANLLDQYAGAPSRPEMCGMVQNFFINFALLAHYAADLKVAYNELRLRLIEIDSIKETVKQMQKQLRIMGSVLKSTLGAAKNKDAVNAVINLIDSVVPVKSIGGNESFPDFFAQHKAQLKEWAKKPPKKDKLLKTLALWTGAEGEEAITRAFIALRNSVPRVLLHFGRMYGLKSKFDKVLTSLVNDTVFELANYYLRHKQKYVGLDGYSRVELKGCARIIEIRDEFLSMRAELRQCQFDYVTTVVDSIITALNKVDKRALLIMGRKICDKGSEQKDGGDDILLRKKLKTEIVELAKDCATKLKCLEYPKASFKIEEAISVETLLGNTKAFVRAEEDFHNHIHEVQAMFDSQSEMLHELKSRIELLCGPSTLPCLKRIFHAIQNHIHDGEFNDNVIGRFKMPKEYAKLVNLIV